MKLRMRHNSVRIRLLRAEVEKLATTGLVSETIEFPGGGTLRYELCESNTEKSIMVTFSGGILRVLIPKTILADWISSEMVGIESEIAIGGPGTLSILVEKDFVCRERSDDPDNSDAYPNPARSC
jgi:hypothetical protein